MIKEMCEECEGSGHDSCWCVGPDGAEEKVFDSRYPCRHCSGLGYFVIPTEPVEMEDLVPLIPKDL